ncbi:hypothetical protein N5P37_001134 [Trichoderma harzianum]|uniref:Uncharacterized protein n=1 Tax=Trichoderma harzianum CBS 226.95 TaxID=983964 RepID=A0A2T4AGM3_TRIHA|nr:hypothetical protein M431DRAFT_479959 [Trichoderma harzianum CBS 226.95]KAK0766242.1 hypothetical protein N5P37_001134 [Trichoderma harzianum]PKK49819.1 hypothetical protein CI102_3410 [Trichoderma harzianum]PTB56240.1 hypothetical protein M431DRAFT_479959 [Trichoderma harzianum CBS 226.95]
MRITIPKSRFAVALGAGRYWQGVARSEYRLAKRSPWSDPSRPHQVRYGLNIGQMPRHYTTRPNSKDRSTNISHEAPKSGNIRLSPTKGLELPISMPFTRLDEGTWLHNRPETDVYKLLIDSYRLRVEDTHVFKGEAMEDSIYAGCKNGRRGFRKFLRRAATIPGLLPPWWTKEKSTACEKFGMVPSQWQNLRYTARKREIMEHYGDHLFPMQLRMLAEAVYGIHPCGTAGTKAREYMMAEERGEGKTTVIDMSEGIKVDSFFAMLMAIMFK